MANDTGPMDSMDVMIRANMSQYYRDMATFQSVSKQAAVNVEKTLNDVKSFATSAIAPALGALGLGGGILGAAYTGFNYNSMMEQQITSFKTLLGTAEKAAQRMEDLRVFAKETPYELPEVVQASKMLQAFTGNALSSGRGLRLVGDAASAVGADFQRTSFWMGRLFSGLRSGGPIGESLMNLTEMGLVTAKSRAELESYRGKALTVEQAMKAMSSSFGQFNGAMIAQSTTWKGLTAQLSDGVTMLLGDISKPMFDSFKTGLAGVVSNWKDVETQVWVVVDAVKMLYNFIDAHKMDGLLGGTGGILAAGLANPATLAAAGSAFAVAVAAAPAWVTVGGVIAAGFIASYKVSKSSAQAINALDAQSNAERAEDARRSAIQEAIYKSTTEDELRKQIGLARTMAAGYELSAKTATNDGGLFGTDGEKDRLLSMADAYRRMADTTERDLKATLARNAALMQSRATAQSLASWEEARKRSTESVQLYQTQIIKQAESMEKSADGRLRSAEFEKATLGGKIELLRQEADMARALYADRMEISRAANNELVAINAEKELRISLLDIEKRRKSLSNSSSSSEEALRSFSFEKANLHEKLRMLREQEEIAKRTYADQMEAARVIGSDEALNNAQDTFDLSIKKSAAERKDLIKQFTEGLFPDMGKVVLSRTGLGSGAEGAKMDIDRKNNEELSKIRILLERIEAEGGFSGMAA